MIEFTIERSGHPAWFRVIVPSYADKPLSGMGELARDDDPDGRFEM